MPRIDPNNAIVCFRASSRLPPSQHLMEECLFLTLSNPWTNIHPHSPYCPFTHTNSFTYTIHAQTEIVWIHHTYWMCKHFIHGNSHLREADLIQRNPLVSYSVTVKDPKSFDLFQDTFSCGQRLLHDSNFLVFLLSFVHFPFCYLLLCCFWSFMPFCLITTLKASNIDYLPCITQLVWLFFTAILFRASVSEDECVPVCLCLLANISGGICGNTSSVLLLVSCSSHFSCSWEAGRAFMSVCWYCWT